MTMTMNFDLNNTQLGNATSSSMTRLKGNMIHDVLFKGVEYSTSEDGKWEFMDIKFVSEDGKGYFRSRTFGLRPDAGERKKSQFGENPSEYESFMMLIKHLLNAVAKELLQDMINGKIVFTPAKGKDSLFKQYVNFISKALENFKDRKTKIKLINNNKGEAAFPGYFAAVGKEGDVYMRTNFIGDDLKFTDKEIERIKLMDLAKPTVMQASPILSNDTMSLGDTDVKSNASGSEDSDVDINNIDLDF